jgi:hypothetical protein
MIDLSHISRRQLLAGAAATGLAGFASPALAKAPMANAQAPSFYRFRLGAFELTAVSDGPLQMGAPQPNIFTETSKDEMVKTLADNFLPADAVSMEQNALVVNTGNQLILATIASACSAPTARANSPMRRSTSRSPTTISGPTKPRSRIRRSASSWRRRASI